MMAHWEQSVRKRPKVSLDYVEHFDARGMLRVYRRSDYLGRGRTFNMDVWLTRGGRLLVRFWAHRDDVDWISLEVKGHAVAAAVRSEKREMGERWVPRALRDAYDDWILSEF